MTGTEPVVRIGVLGAANISGKAVMLPAAEIDGLEVVAIAARDRQRAAAQADLHGIPAVYDSYADVLAAADVDAVYNPLPISLHREWTIAALEAGKHVLCEKPFASNAKEARSMVEAGRRSDLVVMEAFHWRYHPLASRIEELLASGRIGDVRAIDAGFTAPINAADDVRQSYELSGGALMDLGCYPLQWVRFAARCLGATTEPRLLSAVMTAGRPDVDVLTEISLSVLGDVRAEVRTAMDDTAVFGAWLNVHGSTGSLRVQNPLAPHVQHELILETSAGEQREQVSGLTTYHHQLLAFRDGVLGTGEILTGGNDAIANMELIDAAYTDAGFPLRGH